MIEMLVHPVLSLLACKTLGRRGENGESRMGVKHIRIPVFFFVLP